MSATAPKAPTLGLLTRTVSKSPIIHSILPVHLRHTKCCDLVYIGEDFIHVNEVIGGDHLRCIVTKSDFDCSILAAATIGLDPCQSQLQAPLVKLEEDASGVDSASSREALQGLVLTLASAELVILYLTEHPDHTFHFIVHHVPLPKSPHLLERSGRHVAVDPFSRSIAVTVSEDAVLLASGKMSAMNDATVPQRPLLTPRTFSEERIWRVSGTIQRMSFLHPPASDPDSIILLLVVVAERKTLIQRIEWINNSDIGSARLHSPQRVDTDGQFPNFIIPLRFSADFLLFLETSVILHTEVMSGHMIQNPVKLPSDGADGQKISTWAAWSTSPDDSSYDSLVNRLYVVRQDGSLISIEYSNLTLPGNLLFRQAGRLGCHVDGALAVLRNADGNDVLAVGGDMSLGSLSKITDKVTQDCDRNEEVMSMDKIGTLANWGPSIDLVVSDVAHGHEKLLRTRNGVFVTSGRQPYGRITELRRGIEARLSGLITYEGFGSCTGLWVLPLQAQQDVLLLISNPGSTALFLLQVDENNEVSGVIPEHGQDYGYNLEHQTLAAASRGNGCGIQITASSVLVSVDGRLTHEANLHGWKVLVADIAEQDGFALCVLRLDQNSKLVKVRFPIAISDNMDIETEELSYKLEGDVTSIKVFSLAPNQHFAAICTTAGHLSILDLSTESEPLSLFASYFSGSENRDFSCESMDVLCHDLQPQGNASKAGTLLCGLRNGLIYNFGIGFDRDSKADVRSLGHLKVGVTGVRVAKYSAKCESFKLSAVATCGSGLYLVTIDNGGTGLGAARILVTDQSEPSAQQDFVNAFAQMPDLESLHRAGLASALFLISQDDGLIVDLENIESTVPRSIPVSGTPSRLIYSSRLSCFIAASVKTSSRSAATSSNRSSGERTSRALIAFRPPGSQDWTYDFLMQAGERVYGMEEWHYKNREGKEYVFILVASGINNGQGHSQGRVHLLQPIVRRRQIVDVKLATSTQFTDPVYSLALYGSTMYVICSGTWLFVYEYQEQNRKYAALRVTGEDIAANFRQMAPKRQIQAQFTSDSLVSFEVEMEETEHTITFKPVSLDGKQRIGLHHLTLTLKDLKGPGNSDHLPVLNIMTTKYGEIRGLLAPTFTTAQQESLEPDQSLQVRRPLKKTSLAMFDAQLPRSLSRLRMGPDRSLWCPEPPAGVIEDRIIGVAVDGTVVQLSILNEDLWSRLKWVQTLCERSQEICPFSTRLSEYGLVGKDRIDDFGVGGAPSPMGMTASSGTPTEEIEQTAYATTDMHVNGDILQRLLERKGSEVLEQILHTEAERKDRIGDFVRQNLHSELTSIESTLSEIRAVLGGSLI